MQKHAPSLEDSADFATQNVVKCKASIVRQLCVQFFNNRVNNQK